MRAAIVVLAALLLPAQATQGPEGTAVVRGHVVDAVTGKPLRNVGIRFNPVQRTFTPGIDISLPARNAVSDARGSFEIANLAAGEYTIYSTGNSGDYLEINYGSRAPGGGGRPLQIADNARLDLTLQAWPGASISGRVVDERGRPVVGAGVQLAAHGAGTYGSATTDDRGEYFLARLAPGEYTVGVPLTLTSRTLAAGLPARSSSDYHPPFQPYLLDRAARTILTTYGAPLPPPSTEGRANLYVTSFYGGGTSVTDAKYFSLSVGEARAGVEVVLRDEPGFRVAGTAVGPGGAMTGIVLTLVRDGAPESYRNGRITATAAADGTFVFVATPAGSYTLTASRRVPPLTDVSLVYGTPSVAMDDVIFGDREALWAEMPVAVGGDDVDGVQVMLRPGTAFAGRVVFDDQSPVDFQRSSPRISLARMGSEARGDDVALQFKPDGAFAGRAKPGRYFLTAGGPMQGWSFKTARLDGREIGDGPIVLGDTAPGDLEVVYSRATTVIRGAVADPRGGATADATIVIFPADRNRWDRVDEFGRGRMIRPTAPNYEITGLMPGEYFVAALDESAQRTSLSRGFFERAAGFAVRVQLRTGEPVTQNLSVRSEKAP